MPRQVPRRRPGILLLGAVIRLLPSWLTGDAEGAVAGCAPPRDFQAPPLPDRGPMTMLSATLRDLYAGDAGRAPLPLRPARHQPRPAARVPAPEHLDGPRARSLLAPVVVEGVGYLRILRTLRLFAPTTGSNGCGRTARSSGGTRTRSWPRPTSWRSCSRRPPSSTPPSAAAIRRSGRRSNPCPSRSRR